MNEEVKLIEEQKKKLPPDLVKAIEMTDWKSQVQSIGKENNLTPEQIVSLEQETMLSLYGFQNPLDFPTNLVGGIGVNEEVAEKIFDSIWNKIMKPISDKADELESKAPKTSNDIHPVIEKGEMVHSVPHVEQPKMTPPTPPSPMSVPTTPSPTQVATPAPAQTPTQAPKQQIPVPDYRYPDGSDPYREPTK